MFSYFFTMALTLCIFQISTISASSGSEIFESPQMYHIITDDGSCQSYNKYPQFCKLAADNETIFLAFRSNIFYQAIVENVSYEQGLDIEKIINNEYQYLLPYFDKICSEDRIGNPVIYFFPLTGISCSSTVIRYVKIAGDLHKAFGDLNNLNIVEIGGGFGGQCKILHDIFGFKSYTIIDLPECTPLINKYLSYFNIENTQTVNSTELKNQQQYDLVISNYAFSEIDREGQLQYIEKIINLAPMGYITYDYLQRVNPLLLSEFVLLLSAHKKVILHRENPATGDNNFVILWYPKE